MKAKSVNFERGQSPKDSLGIGLGDEFLVLSVDAQDDFGDLSDDEYDGRLVQVDGPMSYDKAKKLYDELEGNVSNVYLVNIIEKEEYI